MPRSSRDVRCSRCLQEQAKKEDEYTLGREFEAEKVLREKRGRDRGQFTLRQVLKIDDNCPWAPGFLTRMHKPNINDLGLQDRMQLYQVVARFDEEDKGHLTKLEFMKMQREYGMKLRFIDLDSENTGTVSLKDIVNTISENIKLAKSYTRRNAIRPDSPVESEASVKADSLEFTVRKFDRWLQSRMSEGFALKRRGD